MPVLRRLRTAATSRTGARSRSVARSRTVTALLIITVFVVSIFLIEAIFQQTKHDQQDELKSIATSVMTAAAIKDPFHVIDELEECVHAGVNSELSGIWNEIALPENAQEVRCDPTDSILGCVAQGEEEQVMDSVIEKMKEKGWTAVPLSGVAGATFIRNEGGYPWFIVTATDVETCISVVYRRVVG